MPTHYNYALDKEIADKTEKEVAEVISRRTKYNLIEIRKDNKYDLKFKNKDDYVFTVEVKEDFTCERTGNVGVEYSCRGAPSGIQVSKADYYCYKIHEPNKQVGIYLISTKKLKALIETKQYHRAVNGGDVGSDSLNYLFNLDIIKNNSTKL